MISKAVSKDISATYSSKRDGDIRFSRLDNRKAETILGWKPTFDIHTGLAETLKYYNTF
jgi:UDP-glucose 4-epimerase